ncbi:MAG: hypothetical protein JMDDDDMK_02347 [Acidobacteria bacterium]|nr:hypothetical protein [Acidobacteriota bacterium]
MINASHHHQHRHQAKHRFSVWLPLVLALSLASPLAAQQKKQTKGAEPQGAKSIFYNPSTGAASNPAPEQKSKKQQSNSKILTTRRGKPKSEPEKPQEAEPEKPQEAGPERLQAVSAQNPALHYWFEMEGRGKVSEDHIFYTGDRLRLHLRSNIGGYLTLWAYDPAGNSNLLFPTSNSSGSSGSSAESRALTYSENDGYVQANTDYSPGVITFTPPAEDERLLIFFSKSKDDVPAPQDNRLTAEQINQATQAEGGKSLSFEEEKKDQATFGSYVANQRGGAIAKEIRLKHRPRKE